MFKYKTSEINPNVIKDSDEDIINDTTVDLRIYSTKYNVLRAMHGYASKAFF